MTPSAVSTSTGPGGLPQLTLRPASGPVGTYVTISGQLTPDQVRTYESEIQRPAYFSLITDVCRLRERPVRLLGRASEPGRL